MVVHVVAIRPLNALKAPFVGSDFHWSVKRKRVDRVFAPKVWFGHESFAKDLPAQKLNVVSLETWNGVKRGRDVFVKGLGKLT